MRSAIVTVHGTPAAVLEELEPRGRCRLSYRPGYDGPPVSLTMPVAGETYVFPSLPPFFEGLLPEGVMLEALLRQRKLDDDDLFGQLLAVGADVVGAVTVEPLPGTNAP